MMSGHRGWRVQFHLDVCVIAVLVAAVMLGLNMRSRGKVFLAAGAKPPGDVAIPIYTNGLVSGYVGGDRFSVFGWPYDCVFVSDTAERSVEIRPLIADVLIGLLFVIGVSYLSAIGLSMSRGRIARSRQLASASRPFSHPSTPPPPSRSPRPDP